MTKTPPSNNFRTERDVLDLLMEVMDREGPELFAALLRAKADSEPEQERLSLKSLASRAREHLGALVRETTSDAEAKPRLRLPSPDSPGKLTSRLPAAWQQRLAPARRALSQLPSVSTCAEVGIKLSLNSVSYLSGVALGLGLPDFNLKFYRRGTPRNAITLSSAPFFSMDLTLRWMSAVLVRTLQHPEATESHRQSLRAVERALHHLLTGMHTGLKAQRRPTTPEEGDVGIALEEPEYRMAEALFSQLLAQTKE